MRRPSPSATRVGGSGGGGGASERLRHGASSHAQADGTTSGIITPRTWLSTRALEGASTERAIKRFPPGAGQRRNLEGAMCGLGSAHRFGPRLPRPPSTWWRRRWRAGRPGWAPTAAPGWTAAPCEFAGPGSIFLTWARATTVAKTTLGGRDTGRTTRVSTALACVRARRHGRVGAR